MSTITMSLHTPTQCLRGDALLADAAAFHARLEDLLSSGQPVTLDLSEIGATDVSFVQLIVSASATAARSRQPLSLTGLSPGLRGTFEKAGVGIDPTDGRITRN